VFRCCMLNVLVMKDKYAFTSCPLNSTSIVRVSSTRHFCNHSSNPAVAGTSSVDSSSLPKPFRASVHLYCFWHRTQLPNFCTYFWEQYTRIHILTHIELKSDFRKFNNFKHDLPCKSKSHYQHLSLIFQRQLISYKTKQIRIIWKCQRTKQKL
jgi:hypothetical protein